jgi:hypothetical protein
MGESAAILPHPALQMQWSHQVHRSGIGSCVLVRFPAFGQVPFAADVLFTLPFVVIISDLLLIVSKINTAWLIPWEQGACSVRLCEPLLRT